VFAGLLFVFVNGVCRGRIGSLGCWFRLLVCWLWFVNGVCRGRIGSVVRLFVLSSYEQPQKGVS